MAISYSGSVLRVLKDDSGALKGLYLSEICTGDGSASDLLHPSNTLRTELRTTFKGLTLRLMFMDIKLEVDSPTMELQGNLQFPDLLTSTYIAISSTAGSPTFRGIINDVKFETPIDGNYPSSLCKLVCAPVLTNAKYAVIQSIWWVV